MTDKETAIADLIDNDKYVLIILTDIPNNPTKQTIKIHTDCVDTAMIIMDEAIELMKTNAETNL